jgi:hypothetical protein
MDTHTTKSQSKRTVELGLKSKGISRRLENLTEAYESGYTLRRNAKDIPRMQTT